MAASLALSRRWAANLASATAAATPAAAPSLQLVRDFIQDSLYHPTQGYFTRQQDAAVVGSPPAPLDFPSLAGKAAYLQAVSALYRQLAVQWLTPAELFQPHFGAAIAACIWQQHSAAGRAQQPLRIYELGGGTGTLARDVLDWLREHQPKAYASVRYTCVEISAQLAALQESKVAGSAAAASAAGSGPRASAAARLTGGHAGRFEVRRQDATDVGAWARHDAAERQRRRQQGSLAASSSVERAARGQHVYIVACEVLDNLPHDRVWRQSAGEPWQQTLVELPPSGAGEAGSGWRPREVLQPLYDPLIRRCLAALQTAYAMGSSSGAGADSAPADWGGRLAGALHWLLAGAAGEVEWLPTGCLRLLDTLHQVRPSHTLIAADFDALPEVQIEGRNAPLVATTTGGTTIDHPSYLVPRGAADIFFPTDFRLLRQLYLDSAAHVRQRRDSSPSSAAGTEAAGAAEALLAAPGPEAAAGVSASHLSTREFMQRWAEGGGAGAATQTGYNPLLEDYSNTAFFLASSE